MKRNYLFLLLAAFALVLTACSKDDDDDDISPSAIKGRWLAVSSSDGDYEEADNVIWEFKDGKVTMSEDGVIDDVVGYTISGNKLILDFGGGDKETITIVTLTATKLELSESGYKITFRKL